MSGLPAQKVAGYHTGDRRLGWQLGPHLTFSLAGQNLLQPSHLEFGGDPGPLVAIKRSVYAKLVWRG
jgi:hypothetical protein